MMFCVAGNFAIYLHFNSPQLIWFGIISKDYKNDKQKNKICLLEVLLIFVDIHTLGNQPLAILNDFKGFKDL